eukprot:600456-Rhodomonas_salina.1
MNADPSSTPWTREMGPWLYPHWRSQGSSHKTFKCLTSRCLGSSLPSISCCWYLTRMQSSRNAVRTCLRLTKPSIPYVLMILIRSSSVNSSRPMWSNRCRSFTMSKESGALLLVPNHRLKS